MAAYMSRGSPWTRVPFLLPSCHYGYIRQAVFQFSALCGESVVAMGKDGCALKVRSTPKFSFASVDQQSKAIACKVHYANLIHCEMPMDVVRRHVWG